MFLAVSSSESWSSRDHFLLAPAFCFLIESHFEAVCYVLNFGQETMNITANLFVMTTIVMVFCFMLFIVWILSSLLIAHFLSILQKHAALVSSVASCMDMICTSISAVRVGKTAD